MELLMVLVVLRRGQSSDVSIQAPTTTLSNTEQFLECACQTITNINNLYISSAGIAARKAEIDAM